MKNLLLISVVVILLYSPFANSVSYDQCESDGNDGLICRDLGWTSLPASLPKNLVKLTITGSNVNNISASRLVSKSLERLTLTNLNLRRFVVGQFYKLPNLAYLTVNNNSISSLPRNLLKNNRHLIVLDMSHNNIENVADGFLLPLTKLLVLKLVGNKIGSLKGSVFKNQGRLTDCELSYNQIPWIDGEAFSGASKIKRISLRHNQIVKLPAKLFAQIPDVKIFDVANNELKKFPWKKYVHQSNHELTDLNIRANHIRKIPKSFLSTIQLSFFEFGDNPLYCDCGLDWVRAKAWIGINITKAGQGNEFLVYKSSETDLSTQKCAGPGIYTGESPVEFDTLCDVNECLEMTHVCKEHSTCVNTAGSYDCECNDGFFGHGKLECTDINECLIAEPTQSGKVCGVNATCTNTIGSYRCDCQKGYEGDGQICKDVDECEVFGDDLCRKFSSCVNTDGSSTCVCKPGFRSIHPSDDESECVDVDECKENTGLCPEHLSCVNNEGSYRCECPTGFAFNLEKKCEDIDECTLETDDCGKGSFCVNTKGNYTCRCRDGYYYSHEKKCEDINECYYVNIHQCHTSATCENTEGGFICLCNRGYTGDGHICTLKGQPSFGMSKANKKSSGLSIVVIIAIVVVSLFAVIGTIVLVKYRELICKSKNNVDDEDLEMVLRTIPLNR